MNNSGKVSKSRLAVVGIAVLCVLIIISAVFPISTQVFNTGFLSIGLRQAEANPGWLSGWDKRVKLTTDQTDIDADLTDFPILLYLSTASGRNAEDISFVFDELQSDANRKKIAVTTSDATTECYVEIEKWDDANEQAWLWIKAPSTNGTIDTNFYLYYDADHADNTDHVGDTNSAAAESVWDSNFKFVSHMADGANTSQIYDSTGNNKDGTKKGAAEPTVANWVIGNAQDFDGSNDYISAAISPSLSTFTLECIAKPDVITAGASVVADTGAVEAYIQIGGAVNYYWQYHGAVSTTTAVVGTTYYLAGVQNGSAETIYINGASKGTASYAITIDGLYIGRRSDGVYFNGKIDEVRVSNVARSAAWVKATYYTEIDGLLDWGSEEGAAPAITNTPDNYGFGILATSTNGSTTINYFTLNNTGNCPVDITIQGTNLAGGDDTWTLSGTATPGENIYGLYAGLDDADDDFDVVVNTTANAFVADLPEATTQAWGLKLYMPTSVTGYDAQQMSGNITLIASAA